MREIERSAASVEEALEAALTELGVSEQEAEVDIVQEPQRGLLGFGSQEAVVRVRVRNGARQVEDEEVDLDEQADAAGDFLEGLLDKLGLEADIEQGIEDGVMYVDILGPEESDDMGLLIGRHGLTLDALQEITRSAVQRKTQTRCRVIVDVEDYRKRRKDQLVSKARGLASKVKRTGRPERMEPMSPYERKIVHDAVGEIGGLETLSEGEEPDRRVVIRKEG